MGVGVDAPRAAGRPGGLHARHRPPQRARDLPRRGARRDLRPGVRGDEPDHARRRRRRAPRARALRADARRGRMTGSSLADGVYTVVPTPFTADGSLDLPSLERLVSFLASTGIEGVLVLGVMGEAPKLVPDERRAVVETSIRAAEGDARRRRRHASERRRDARARAERAGRGRRGRPDRAAPPRPRRRRRRPRLVLRRQRRRARARGRAPGPPRLERRAAPGRARGAHRRGGAAGPVDQARGPAHSAEGGPDPRRGPGAEGLRRPRRRVLPRGARARRARDDDRLRVPRAARWRSGARTPRATRTRPPRRSSACSR